MDTAWCRHRDLYAAAGLALTSSIVTRFSVEVDQGRAGARLQRTMRTAGRTVLFSGLTVSTSLSAAALPGIFLRSMGLGALARCWWRCCCADRVAGTDGYPGASRECAFGAAVFRRNRPSRVRWLINVAHGIASHNW